MTAQAGADKGKGKIVQDVSMEEDDDEDDEDDEEEEVEDEDEDMAEVISPPFQHASSRV